MKIPDSTSRPIQYPLARTLAIETNTGDYVVAIETLDGMPLDPNEKTKIIIEASLNDLVVIASCVDVGSDIAYGTDALIAWVTWIRLIKSMSVCDEVANCIQGSPEVQSAITNLMSGSSPDASSGGELGAGVNTIVGTGNNTINAIAGSACTDDTLYATAVGITDVVFDAVQTLYDLLELATTKIDLLGELSDNVPIVGVAVSSALDFAIYVRDVAAAQFAVYDDVPKRTEIACDIFCIMRDNNCSLTFADLAEYFMNKATIPVIGRTLATIIPDIPALSTADDVGKASIALFFAILERGARYVGYRGQSDLMVYVTAFRDDTDNNWTALCDPCAPLQPWCKLFVFASDLEGWVISSGNYPYTEAGETGIGGDSSTSVDISRTVNTYVERLRVNIFGVGSNASGTLLIYNDGVEIARTSLGDGDRNFILNTYIGTLRIFGSRQFAWGMDSVKLEGSGVSPFSTNC